MSFSRLLIANRGEIACRVIRTAHAMGLSTVAVYSDPDASAPHVSMADRAVALGPAPGYLDSERIIEAAHRAGADAVHPGYGFLSENARFAEACAEAGLIFVGPPPEAVRLMGDKAAARQRMQDAGVPCVPGYDGDDQSDGTLAREADAIGYPVLVKAAAGGGGRGMRRVGTAADLPGALAAARREAKKAFGDDRLLLEKLVENARHVEIQVMADQHGAVIHLGERDCSTQRRYQKVIEEAPSPAVNPELRARMGAAAVAAAQAIGYVGAGTVELLLGQDEAFYFLEMNTRLQVEHPVTELVTGLDLVAMQLEVASGAHLSLTQDELTLTGHAIEARLYAEDPYAGHAPQAGPVLAFEPATGEGLRCDHGLRSVGAIGTDYDPMVAKLIAYGRTREEARRRLGRALDETVLLGIRTNQSFLASILRSEVFASGAMTTGALESAACAPLHEAPTPPDDALAVAAVLLAERAGRGAGWSNTRGHYSPMLLSIGESAPQRVALRRGNQGWVTTTGDAERLVRTLGRRGARVRVEVDGLQRTVQAAFEGDALHLRVDGTLIRVAPALPAGAQPEKEGGDGVLRSPFSGVVVRVIASPGAEVRRGDVVLAIEAMKIESPLTAGVGGVLAEIRVSEGDQVSAGQVLARIEPQADSD